MARVLVTGGAGFIGSHVTDRMLLEGHETTVVDDLSTGRLENLAPALASERPPRFHELDLNGGALDAAVGDAAPDLVVHLAAQMDVRRSVDDPVHDAMVNVLGTVRLLEACRRHGVRKVVFATSGGCIYGEPGLDELPVPETHEGHAHSPYGASKRSAEEYLHTFELLYGLRWTSLAFSNVYGPRQDPRGEAGVVAILARHMLDDDEVVVFGDGEQTRDFVYVGDVVEAVVAASGRADGLRCNIGTGRRTSVNELARTLGDLTGYDRPVRYAPARDGELRHSALDVRRARDAMGWTPSVGLREGLAATVDWVRGG